ncbi:MAG: response regulator transcription factor [Bacteroidales bacterium]|nr:response regulator transcription factor [Bacteroidales bacterium]
MDTIKILLCEDDKNLGCLLKEYLIQKGYECDLIGDGEAGYQAFINTTYSICILDVMMPKKDGFTLAQDIRKINTHVPIIFLTAKTLKEDVLEGFRIGADDYITKPFSMEELLLRIEAIMRRVSIRGIKNEVEYKLGSLIFNTQRQELITPTESIRLTTKEAELLTLLAQNVNNVLERNIALKTIWIEDNYFNARSMDVYITKLRKMIKVDPDLGIINIHGKGYKLVDPNQPTT